MVLNVVVYFILFFFFLVGGGGGKGDWGRVEIFFMNKQ